MLLDDYESVFRLWSIAEGMSLGEEDSREGIALYLRRNPKSCFVAQDGAEIVGAVLSGHEGRRGILRHLVVRLEYQKKVSPYRWFERALKRWLQTASGSVTFLSWITMASA
jgi:N-acetylglutamate synthase